MGRKKGADDDSWKPFKCNICSKSFIYPMNYKTHESKHKKEDCKQCLELDPKPSTCPHIKYNCVYCNKVFLDCADYKKDQAQHKLKPECRYCKKTFRQLYSLKIHMNIHTGRRPYVCPICGYSCHSPQVLRHHELFNHVKRPAITQHNDQSNEPLVTSPTMKIGPVISRAPPVMVREDDEVSKTEPVKKSVVKRPAGPANMATPVRVVAKVGARAIVSPGVKLATRAIVTRPAVVRSEPIVTRSGPPAAVAAAK